MMSRRPGTNRATAWCYAGDPLDHSREDDRGCADYYDVSGPFSTDPEGEAAVGRPVGDHVPGDGESGGDGGEDGGEGGESRCVCNDLGDGEHLARRWQGGEEAK